MVLCIEKRIKKSCAFRSLLSNEASDTVQIDHYMTCRVVSQTPDKSTPFC